MSYVEIGVTTDLTPLELVERVRQLLIDQDPFGMDPLVEIQLHSGEHAEDFCGWDGTTDVGAMAHTGDQ